MEQKNYTEVLIDGTIYTLGGVEGEAYLQRVAAYLNEKISSIRQQGGFRKQSAEYQALMVELNITDDYFKEQERADLLAEQKAAMEKDAYSLKHELITTQMKLEKDQTELDRLKREHKAMSQTPHGRLQQDLEYANAEIGKAREEAEVVKAEAERQIAEARKAAADETEAAKADARQQIAAAQEEAQQQISAAKAEANAQVEAIQVQLAEAQAKVSELQQEYDAAKRELEQIKALKAAAAAYTGRPPR